MKGYGRVPLIVLGGVLALLGVAGPVRGGQPPASELRVAQQRAIEVPDTRLISLSPDGRWLAAAKPAGAYGRGQLCVYAVDGLAEQACGDLSVLDAGLRLEDVVWSPDGTRLAFAEDTFKFFRDGDLWVMDAATGAIDNVGDDGFAGEDLPIFGDDPSDATIYLDVNPAWTPDGRSLAFSRTTLRDGEFRGNEVVVVDLDGGAPRRLVRVTNDEPGVVYLGMRWAPDGQRLYYSLNHADAENPRNGIWVVDADGRNNRQVLATTDPELGPPSVVQVSPRGDRLLAFYPIAASQYAAPTSPLYALVDVRSGVATPLTLQGADDQELAYLSLATISPDGSKLLVTSRLADGNARVYARDLDADEAELLARDVPGAVGVALGLGLTWATDGTVFVPNGASLSGGTLLRLEGGAATPPAPVFEPPTRPAMPVLGAIAPGATVFVNDDVSLRAAPARDAPVVVDLEQGTAVEVIGEAEEGDGFVWWPVREPTTRSLGYVRAEFLSLTET